MKISQLVATATKTPYHESVASRLPRGIKTQQQLFNLGYKIAVEDLGLAKAKTLNENFAAKLVNSYHNQSLNEGVGSFLGKAAGSVARGIGGAVSGIKGAWQGAKDAYNQGATGGNYDKARAAVSGTTAPASNAAPAPASNAAPAPTGAADRPYVAPVAAPSPGGATPTTPTAGSPPSSGGGSGIGDIMKAIDGLDPASKKQLAGELDKSINTPPPVDAAAAPGAAPTAPGAAPTAPEDGKIPKFNKFTGEKFASPEDAKAFMNSPEYKMSHDEWEAAQAAKAPPAAPAPTSTAPAAPAPNYGSGQTQAPAPSKVNYSGIPKAAPLPQATPTQGAYSVKNTYAAPAPSTPAPAAAPAPQFKGPKVNGLQVRNMGEGKKLKFRSNFLGMDL